MRVLTTGFLCVPLACTSVFAQFNGGVNIDFNSATGPGAGQPSVLYGGAAGQTGYWNPVNGPYGLGTSWTIRNLANSADAVTLVVESTNNASSYTFNNASTSGDAELLFDDIHDVGVGGLTNYSIGPFAGGVYDIYTYAVAPDNAADRTGVSVYTTSTGASAEVLVGGAIPAGGTTTPGVTHAVHRVAVARGERVYINARAATGPGSVNGIQVKPVTGFTRLYVDSSVAGTVRDGLTWGTAMNSLQRAVSVANDTPSVTEIWVTNGEYRPDEVLYATNDRAAVFRPRAGLAIYGGFFGYEASVGARTISPVIGTFITGGLGATTTADDSYHLMYAPGTGTLTLDGLKFQSTHPLGDLGGDIEGSGLHVHGGTVVVRDCLFRFCIGVDAAMVVEGGASVTMTRTTFDRNSSTRTTALRVEGAGTALTADRCVFRRQFMIGAYLGGLIDANDLASLTLTNSLVHDNCPAGTLGGMFMFSVAHGSARIDNCTFANNLGGGMYLTAGAGGPVSVACHNCILWGNRRSIDPGETLEQHQIFSLGAVPNTTFTDSIIEGYEGTRWIGLANSGADPRFIDPDGADNFPGTSDDNYRLASRSPARDSAWYGGLLASARTLDLDGNTRVVDDPLYVNSGYSSGATPLDRGCYEAQGSSAACPGDIGQAGGLPGADGIRDNNDFIVFINYFFFLNPLADVGIGGGFPGSDGVFDNNDFIAFIDLFFAECP